MFWGIATNGHGNAIELVNFILAQTGFFLIFVLSARFITQRIAKRMKRKTTKKKYTFLKILHIVLGFLLILIGLVHGLLSATDISSFVFSWGFVCWVLSILIAANYYFRKMFKNPKHWIVLHRILAIAIIATAIIHVIMATA